MAIHVTEETIAVIKQRVGTGNSQELGSHALSPAFRAISLKLASIKRHFYASPYEQMLEGIRDNHARNARVLIPNLDFALDDKGENRVWLRFEGSES